MTVHVRRWSLALLAAAAVFAPNLLRAETVVRVCQADDIKYCPRGITMHKPVWNIGANRQVAPEEIGPEICVVHNPDGSKNPVPFIWVMVSNGPGGGHGMAGHRIFVPMTKGR